MWFLPKIRPEIVTFIFHRDAVTCAWIGPSKGLTPYTLHAYNRYSLQKLELPGATLYNPTALKKNINSFIAAHSLTNSLAIFALSKPAAFETILDLPTASPTHKEFDLPQLKKLVWNYWYMYPKDDGHHSFYVCGLSQQLLFQYQLIAGNLPIHLIQIMTETMSFFHLYDAIQGPAFRHAQLACDMTKTNHQLRNYFTPDLVRRMLHIPHSVLFKNDQEISYLISLLGLYIAGKNETS